MSEDETTIKPYSVGGEIALSSRVGQMMAQSMAKAVDHAMAFPPHGAECDYCTKRHASQDAAEARFRRRLARVKRICLTHPTERNLDAYADLRCAAREYGYE